jgi:hypothetical protein
MGYTTEFEGEFSVNPALKPEHRMYLYMFSRSRRMKRNAIALEAVSDPIREAVSLPIGEEGAYCVIGVEDASVTDHNKPPADQPELWCQWIPTQDGTAICWDGNEKFYEYTAWLKYLIKHFLQPWGYALNGEVAYSGEHAFDTGILSVINNEVFTLEIY